MGGLLQRQIQTHGKDRRVVDLWLQLRFDDELQHVCLFSSRGTNNNDPVSTTFSNVRAERYILLLEPWNASICGIGRECWHLFMELFLKICECWRPCRLPNWLS